MKAWVLRSIGDIGIEEREVPSPTAGEVLVRVRAVGVCGSDIPRIYETGAHRMPLVPGHEFAGEVVALGEGVDEKWVDKRVGVFPLIPCRKCGPCINHQYELCRNYDYIGSRRDGAFAEYVCAPADNLIELPDEVSYEAAAMLEPMAVAVHAMKRAGLYDMSAGDCDRAEYKNRTILVCGLGTIGLLLVCFLRDAGYDNLYLIGNKDFQFKMAEKYGVSTDRMCDVRTQNPTEWIVKECGGADIYFECVGKEESLRYGVDSMNPNGRIVTIGNPYGDMTLERDVYWKILRNQLTLTGSWNSTFSAGDDDWKYVLERIGDGGAKPEKLITHRLDLQDLERGLLVMRDKTEEYVKVMVTITRGEYR